MNTKESDCSLVTVTEFASMHDVSRKTVNRWRHRGLVEMAGSKVVVDASNERLASRPKSYRGGVARGPAGGAADVHFERETAALGLALKRLLAAGRKSGSVNELITAVNSVLVEQGAI